MARKIAKKIEGVALTLSYKENLIKALNACRIEIDEAFCKQTVEAYAKTHKMNVVSAHDSMFRMAGTLLYINDNIMPLNEEDQGKLQNYLKPLVTSKVQRKVKVVKEEKVTVSIRDRMEAKAGNLQAELEDTLSPLFRNQVVDFDINAWIKINAIPRNVCKLIASGVVKNLMSDLVNAQRGEPDFLEAYKQLGKKGIKSVLATLTQIVNVLNAAKTEKKVAVRKTAKKTVATASRGVLRTLARTLFDQGKSNREVAQIFVDQYNVKQTTASGYAYSFRKELTK